MIKWRTTVWCRGSKQRELNTKGGRGWKHSWRTMSCQREVLSGDPAGATPRVFKDFMSAWLAKMKGPAANFNFLMTQRNHEQYIDRIWICNKQWPNPQQRIVRVDRKKKKQKRWSFLGSPFRPPLYWEFYFQQFILEEPLRLGVGNKQYTFAPSPWIADELCSPCRRQTGVCVIVCGHLVRRTFQIKEWPHSSTESSLLRAHVLIPSFTEFLILSQGGKFLKIINASFILKKKKKLFSQCCGNQISCWKRKAQLSFLFSPFQL